MSVEKASKILDCCVNELRWTEEMSTLHGSCPSSGFNSRGPVSYRCCLINKD